MALLLLVVLFLAFLDLAGMRVSAAVSFTLINNCEQVVWPATQSNAGKEALGEGGFELGVGERKTIDAPNGWAGRIWGRSSCFFEGSRQSNGSCATGNCEGGGLQCDGRGGSPPITIFEITLSGYGGQDFYDVSLVDGYNLQIAAVPSMGKGNCSEAGCTSNLNLICPPEFQVKHGADIVACKSACEAIGSPEYCCTGSFATPQTCKPTAYSRIFKQACPSAYSYAYDDASSTFTCKDATAYNITFCPPSP